jgi:hypothetical protein
MAKSKVPAYTDNEIRKTLLNYFYTRNRTSRSARSDKTGVAAKISVVYRNLKDSHDLSQQQIRSNLTYLISQGWVEEEQVTKNVPLRTGTIIPQATSYYKITAAGIDKIEGPGEFTMPKFQGIKIEATGQNIITVGDGNRVDARYSAVAGALADLKEAMINSDRMTESDKLAAVADIDTIQAQLAKPEPNKSVVRTIWSAVDKVATLAGLAANAAQVAGLISPLIT